MTNEVFFGATEKLQIFPQNLGFGANLIILSTNPYQAIPHFQGKIDKRQRIAQLIDLVHHKLTLSKITANHLTLIDCHFEQS